MATSYATTANLESRLDALAVTKPKQAVHCSEHSSLPLKIYNYTTPYGQKKASQNRLIAMARGLVIEKITGRIIARPIEAFRNLEARSIKDLKDKTFTVLEKLDGSLGIWFCYKDHWIMATRGSFHSRQALEGQKMAEAVGLTKLCSPELTYCFEIIYPENKITVDYGDRAELVLLAVVVTQTGEDMPNVELPKIAQELGAVCAESRGGQDVEVLRGMDLENEEGFVIRFNETGMRAKIKFDNWYAKQGDTHRQEHPPKGEPELSPDSQREGLMRMKKEARKRVNKGKKGTFEGEDP